MPHAVLSRRNSTIRPRHIGWIALIINVQLVAVLAYYLFSGVTLTEPQYVIYGLIWVNLGCIAIYKTSPPQGIGFAIRRRSIAIAAGYFGLLAVFGGLIGTGMGDAATGFRIALLPPGWGPAVVFAGANVVVAIMPAFLIGYLALAYLVYVTLLETAGSAIAGVLGLFSCVSCTWPILAAVVSSVAGGAGILSATALDASYGLSTAVFVVTIALLYWRPGIR